MIQMTPQKSPVDPPLASQDSKVVAHGLTHMHHDGIGHSDRGSNHELHCVEGIATIRVGSRRSERKRLRRK